MLITFSSGGISPICKPKQSFVVLIRVQYSEASVRLAAWRASGTKQPNDCISSRRLYHVFERIQSRGRGNLWICSEFIQVLFNFVMVLFSSGTFYCDMWSNVTDILNSIRITYRLCFCCCFERVISTRTDQSCPIHAQPKNALGSTAWVIGGLAC